MTKFYELPEQPSCMGRHGRQQSRPRHRRDFTFDTEENERASDLLARTQTKPKSKVTKTPERKKLFSFFSVANNSGKVDRDYKLLGF